MNKNSQGATQPLGRPKEFNNRVTLQLGFELQTVEGMDKAREGLSRASYITGLINEDIGRFNKNKVVQEQQQHTATAVLPTEAPASSIYREENSPLKCKTDNPIILAHRARMTELLGHLRTIKNKIHRAKQEPSGSDDAYRLTVALKAFEDKWTIIVMTPFTVAEKKGWDGIGYPEPTTMQEEVDAIRDTLSGRDNLPMARESDAAVELRLRTEMLAEQEAKRISQATGI